MCQIGGDSDQSQREGVDMKITRIGLDLAKDVFQVFGVNRQGKQVICKQLKRKQVLVFFAQQAPCLVGMEACGVAHYWAR